MATTELAPDPAGKRGVLAYLAVAAAVLLLLMLFGLLMRLAHAEWIVLAPPYFYQLMTAHGIGMVAIVGLGTAAIQWYFLAGKMRLSVAILYANLALFLAGVVLVLAGIFLGGFAAAWTFLYPLPARPMGIWPQWAAASYLVGVLLVGVGFLFFYLDCARAILARYGSLGRALGWPQLFGASSAEDPPPVVVASTVVTFINLLAILVGALILTLSLVNLYWPAFALDALLAKNFIYFFGHVFINSTIYMGVIALYEILPRYSGRPWKSSRPFLAAWTATLLMVLAVYPHHLLMDFANPTWMNVLGQILSYASSLPVVAVTAVGTLANVHRSGLRWDLASGLLFLAVFGWAAGIVPAVVDGTIVVNRVMHNTMWVPGHFHFYLLLGVVAMILGFMAWLAKEAGAREDSALDRAAFWVYAAGGLGFVTLFLLSGRDSVPRRWAVHLPEWLAYDRVAACFAAAVVAAMLVFTLRFLLRLKRIAAA
jgi:cytochrome c oxidase subunit 1